MPRAPRAVRRLARAQRTSAETMAADWRTILNEFEHWQDAYPRVAKPVRLYLKLLDDNELISTGELVDWLWPPHLRTEEGDATIARRLYKALNALHKHQLADCVRYGTPRRLYGKIATPMLWTRPDPSRTAEMLAAERYSPKATEDRKMKSWQLVTDLAMLRMGSEPGVLPIQSRLEALDQIIADARQILEGS